MHLKPSQEEEDDGQKTSNNKQTETMICKHKIIQKLL